MVLGRSINVKNGKIMGLQTANDAGQKPKMSLKCRVLDTKGPAVHNRIYALYMNVYSITHIRVEVKW